MSDLSEYLALALRERLGAHANSAHFVVACSGGVDSIALLHAAAGAVPAPRLTVAHFHHAQRGKSADLDAALVKRTARELKIKFRTAKYRPKKNAPQRVGEEALREARRAFLKKVADGLEAKGHSVFILTAHHRGDQLETFFFRLLRGAGIKGLSAIAPRQGHYLRPWLRLSKAHLIEQAKAHGWAWREDRSNRNRGYFRNRLRHELVPQWDKLTEAFGGPEAWYGRFAELVKELRETEEAVTFMAQDVAATVAVKTPHWTRLNFAAFFDLPVFWQRAVLRCLFTQWKLPALTRHELDRLRALAKSGKGKAELSNGADLIASQGYGFILVRDRKLPSFSIPLGDGVVIRNHQLGDRYAGKSLADRLKKAKVPLPERALYPVMARKNSSEILWHPLSKKGGDLARRFQPSFDTTWRPRTS